MIWEKNWNEIEIFVESYKSNISVGAGQRKIDKEEGIQEHQALECIMNCYYFYNPRKEIISIIVN